MIRLVCVHCEGPARYVIATGDQSMSVCAKHSKKLWRQLRPLSNPKVRSWHQELLITGMIH